MIVTKTGESPQIPGAIEVIIPFEATDVNPKDDINIDGGDLLTIDGRGFPTDPADISVELDDGTDCVTQTLTAT